MYGCASFGHSEEDTRACQELTRSGRDRPVGKGVAAWAERTSIVAGCVCDLVEPGWLTCVDLNVASGYMELAGELPGHKQLTKWPGCSTQSYPL